MSRLEPLHAAVRRQATYALTAFVCAAMALEVLVPGAVLPFIDIVPLTALAAALLVYDAIRRSRAHQLSWVAALSKLGLASVIFAVLFVQTAWNGQAGLAAAVVMAIGIASLAFWPEE